jgi:hypothetical protein
MTAEEREQMVEKMKYDAENLKKTTAQQHRNDFEDIDKDENNKVKFNLL